MCVQYAFLQDFFGKSTVVISTGYSSQERFQKFYKLLIPNILGTSILLAYKLKDIGENFRDIPKIYFNFPGYFMILVIEIPRIKKSQDFKFEQKTVSYISRNPLTVATLINSSYKLKTYGIMKLLKKQSSSLRNYFITLWDIIGSRSTPLLRLGYLLRRIPFPTDKIVF